MKRLNTRRLIETAVVAALLFFAGYHLGHRRAAIMCLQQNDRALQSLHYMLTATNLALSADRRVASGHAMVLDEARRYWSEEIHLWENPLARHIARRSSHDIDYKNGRMAELAELLSSTDHEVVARWRDGLAMTVSQPPSESWVDK
jgi:hypothetical protein